MSARTVAMRFFVAAHREFRDMRAHHVAGQFEVYIPAAGAAFFPLIQLNFAHVRHEIDFELAPPEFPFPAKILFFLGRKAVGEGEAIAKNESQVVEQVHHERRIGHGKISGRGSTLPVEVLVVGVEGNRKEAAGMPFKGVLFAISLPYGSRSMPVEDINHLFVKMLLLFQLFPRRYLAHVAVVGAAGAVEIDECSKPPLVLPWSELYRS